MQEEMQNSAHVLKLDLMELKVISRIVTMKNLMKGQTYDDKAISSYEGLMAVKTEEANTLTGHMEEGMTQPQLR